MHNTLLPAALLVLPDVLTLGCPVCAAARRVHAGEEAVSGGPAHQVSERGCATASDNLPVAATTKRKRSNALSPLFHQR